VIPVYFKTFRGAVYRCLGKRRWVLGGIWVSLTAGFGGRVSSPRSKDLTPEGEGRVRIFSLDEHSSNALFNKESAGGSKERNST